MNERIYEDLLLDRPGRGVAVVTIDRPRKLNALRTQTRGELAAVFEALAEDDEVGAIVLRGAGDRAFSAGQDLTESRDYSAASTPEWEDSWNRMYNAVLGCEKPVVAAIGGYAVGGACHLALVCDIRIGSDRARFGVPEVDDGIPCINGAMFLAEFIGRGRMIEMVLTGRMIDAERATAIGILSRVVPALQLEAESLSEAAMLAAKPRRAIQLDKRWFRELLRAKLKASYEFGRASQEDAFSTGQPQARMADFVEKRRQGRST